MCVCSYIVLCLPSATPRYIYLCDFQRTESYSKMRKTHYVHILTPTQVSFSRNDSLHSLLHNTVNNTAGILGMLTRNCIALSFDIYVITSTIFHTYPCYVLQGLELCKSRNFLFVTSFRPIPECFRHPNKSAILTFAV
jgi:hypothetical protein